MRHNCFNGQTEDAPFMEAVADWLEAVADRQKPTEHWARRSHGWTGSREANAVATAYLNP